MISEKALYWFSKPIVTGYTGTMLKMDVRRHAALPAGARIIAANHPSTTDPFFVASMLRQQSFILIKDLLFKVPLLGAYLRRSGHIPVAAGCGQQALQVALAHLQAGHTILIFPEGTLSPLEGGMAPARTGVARLAILSGAPVVPVGIHLQTERLHILRSEVDGQVEYGRWYVRGPYNLTVGQPLRFSGDVEDRPHVRFVADTIRHHILELARQSENRLNQAPGTLSKALEGA
jgi:1-acyl-sn-glycerol-3-phosphate acyltransferase